MTEFADQAAREDLEALRAAGVHTSISQVVKEQPAVHRWASGRTPTLLLAHKLGWEASDVLPEYRTHPDHGLMVVMKTAAVRTAAKEAAQRTQAGEPTLLGYLVNLKDGGTRIRHLPVVTVRLRNGHLRPQLLTGTAYQAVDAPDVAWAQIPANRPHHPERGVPCALCDVYGATRLRKDQDERPALICDDCAAEVDTTSRSWPVPR
ncbi:hypothetical protein [Streptomyces sp. DH8]|uniref:hypothetical protein n=1 Tax=Streptomyces sp. DH8 TaxID=2857008 RepID=UPI001E5C2946|nr:hypothetical protein [Streptomyces sp. DH8]